LVLCYILGYLNSITMTLNLQKIFFTIFASIISFCLSAQNELWVKTSSENYSNDIKVRRNSFPEKATYYKLNLSALKTQLIGVPIRGQFTGQSPLIIEFPTAEGKLERFRVMESPIMHPDLATKYPMIKTYAAQGVDDPTSTMRFSITQFGFHSMVLSGLHSANYIDPYTTTSNVYMVYDKKSLGANTQNFECLTNEDVDLPSLKNESAKVLNINDQKLRTFRLAQSCNAEYGNIFAGTGTLAQQKANIQAQMVITINRVNGVYERDLAITMEFVPNNDLIIYCGSTTTDPWSNEWNTKTAQTIDAAIGVANYDIGHNFNTTGGGNAGCLSCVCLSTSQTGTHKGRGYTGSTNPTGDPFDIDYVAHEMGHQYGGYHVMNTCSRSGSGSTEVEPASGSSIMGYAGICSSNIQAHSDDDFNYVNVRDISLNVKTGNSSTCAQITNLTNNPPSANAGSDYVIPKSTAYILEGTGSDPDGTASLTYNWSQNDPTQSPGNAAPLSTYAVGPLYRSIPPTVSPNRWMPAIATVLNNTLASTWEVTPSVARTMNFSFIVRDNDVTGGQTASDLMLVTVDGGSGPFVVTSQGTATTWNSGANETITWNVANTTAAPVSSANVNIYLSIDGGYTYPITLASNIPNNGSAIVTVPVITTNLGRIMVRGAGNIFYDINNTNITIQSSEFVMNYSPFTNDVCPPNNAVYTFTYNTFLGFNETTVFSVTGLPAGATAVFNPATATTNSTVVTMTISGLTSAMIGSYNVSAIGTASTVTKTNTLTLNVLAALTPVTLSSPANGATGVTNVPTLIWSAAISPGYLGYQLDVATDPGFVNLVASVGAINTNSFSLSPGQLVSSTTYYWRVKAYNGCGNTPFSSTYSFITNSCNMLTSVNVPLTISASGTPTVTSTLTVSTTGTITDINVVGLNGTHSYMSDLAFTLKSPAGTNVVLFSGICTSQNDFNLSLDDAAPAGAIPCPPTTGGTYQPQAALSAFNGQLAAGVWTLTVVDDANVDGGALAGWGLSICTNLVTGIQQHLFNTTTAIYPNPTNGMLHIWIDSPIEEQFTYKITNSLGQVIASDKIESNKTNQVDLSKESVGVYFVTIQGADGIKTEKIILQK
jgi:subtilisin-like proprotein convertase family protein